MTGEIDYQMPEDVYHARPEMSSTMAKLILRAPAVLRHYLDTPRAESKIFDHGKAVHALVLGVGSDIIGAPEGV